MPVDPAVFASIRRRQRAYWPDGHIRIGDSVPHGNGVRPRKLFTFRFSSPSRPMIEAAADLYGGTVTEMTRGMDKWQVVTAADEIPVLLPRAPLTQWLEQWDGPYCLRRCDGATIEQKSGRPCLCKAEGRLRCSIKTRLSVYPQDLPSLGTWLLVTEGLNAAEDLPNRAAMVEKIGDYVDAWLMVTKGSTIENGKPVTFPVPRLRVEGISPRQVMTGTVPERAAVARRDTPELTTGEHTLDYIAQAMAATTPEQVRDIWRQASQAGHLTRQLGAVLNAIGTTLTTGRQKTGQGVDQSGPAGAQQPSTAPPPSPADRSDPAGPDSPAEQTMPDAEHDAQDDVERESEQWRQHILRLWQGGMTDLHRAFAARTNTTMRRASIDQLKDFAALCERVHADPGADAVDAELGDELGDDDPAPPE
ncbi:recombination directionality factor [Nonomuraea aridisoli]|uniref:Uncharacterized protein n=1 Tax=Nonomuraea aridisoli TaxID=2070368 RepID=A0A2W2F4G9_9ACTN|nr:hypothetical protein [Nonomuraea aridisoli]PZG19918.1 hypothetical protein C1J01_10785 [Nonomuraea aridisoli]